RGPEALVRLVERPARARRAPSRAARRRAGARPGVKLHGAAGASRRPESRRRPPGGEMAFSFDTAEEMVGAELGVSTWQTIDQDLIRAFADATGEHQWIHVDEER